MSAGDRPNGSACELAPLYCVGLLDEAATESFRAHLDGGCDACGAEVAQSGAAVAAIGLSVEPVAPPAGARERLLARARQLAEGAEVSEMLATPELTIVRSTQGEFREIGIPGITARVLFRDEERELLTVLLKMEPGATYPAHTHGGWEECLVLEGDVLVGDEVMGPGDFQRSEGGSLHRAHTTRGGCLLYIQGVGGHAII